MGRLGVVALDGTKIAASASKAANRTGEGLRKLAAGLAGEHAATDAAEDERFGPGVRGDEVPAQVASPRSRAAAADRAARIARALADLEAGREAAEAERAGQDARARAYLEALAAGAGPLGPPPAGAEVAAARIRAERAEAGQAARVAAWEARRAAEDAAGIRRGPGGRKPFPPDAHFQVARARQVLTEAEARQARRERKAGQKKGPGPVRNVTDPDSRLMKTRTGFIQGYNAQNVTSEDGLVIATRLTAGTTDTRWYEAMISDAAGSAAAMAAAGGPGTGQIGLVLADAGYLSGHNLTCPGPDRLIATGKGRDLEKAARGQETGVAGEPEQAQTPPVAAMAARLATADGIAAYRRRSHIGETFHGDLKHNQGLRRLSLRGTRRASGEWTFAAAVRNLRKAITSGHLTSTSLAALAG
jgi:hypothetical protein